LDEIDTKIDQNQKDVDQKYELTQDTMSQMEDNLVNQFNVCESMILQNELARFREQSIKLFDFQRLLAKFKRLNKSHKIGTNPEVDKLKKEIDKGPDPEAVTKEREVL